MSDWPDRERSGTPRAGRREEYGKDEEYGGYDERTSRPPYSPHADVRARGRPTRPPYSRPLNPPVGSRSPGGRPAYTPESGYPSRAPVAPSRPIQAGAAQARRVPAAGNAPRGASAPSAVSTPRGRRWLPILSGVIAGIALVALALAALIILRTPQPTTAALPSPTPTAQALCADLRAQRYDAAYRLLSPGLQRQGTVAQFTASQ